MEVLHVRRNEYDGRVCLLFDGVAQKVGRACAIGKSGYPKGDSKKGEQDRSVLKEPRTQKEEVR